MEVFENASWIPELVFNDLPFDPKTMVTRITKTVKRRRNHRKGLMLHYQVNRGSKEWMRWPPTDRNGTEKTLGKYLNTVADTVRKALRISKDSGDLVYAPVFRDADRKNEEAMERTPELVLVPRHMQKSQDIDWKDVRSFVSLTVWGQNDKCNQIAEYARMCFANQSNRRYVLGLGFCDNKLSAYVFDRSGCISSPYYNVHEHPEVFLRIAIGILFLSDLRMGYDPSFYEDGHSRYIKADGAEYKIVEELHVDKSIRGRGTVCVKAERNGETFVVKDSWVDRTRAIKEIEMLDELRKAGIRKVPTLITGDIVKIQEDTGKKSKVRVIIKSRKDCTEGIRKELIKDIKLRDTEQNLTEGIEIHDHYRIVMQPFGERLDDFDSLTELLSATFDIFETIEALDKMGIVHRDISLDNIILVRDPSKDWRVGYITGFGHAIRGTGGGPIEVGMRAGTVPFMAIDVLRKNTKVERSSIHDAESVLYILLWVACSQGGPHRMRRNDVFDVDTSFLRECCPVEVLDEAKLRSIANAKEIVMEIPERYNEVLGSMHEYFKDLQPYFKSLRRIFFPPNPPVVNKPNITIPVLSYDEMLNLNMSMVYAKLKEMHDSGITLTRQGTHGPTETIEATTTARPLSDVIEQFSKAPDSVIPQKDSHT